MRIAVVLIVAGCSNTPSGADASADASDEAPPSWLGDAGIVARTPSAKPLRELCGIASNPGDMPLGSDPASAALRKGYFDAALDLGGVMIRRDFTWTEIEKTKGMFDFAPYDALVDEATARGVKLLGTLDYGNPWANASSMGDIYFPPTDPNDFARFAGTVAARYKGRVDAWEIWNEPNNGLRFWKPTLSGDPKAYGDLLRAAFVAIHQADPNARVLFGGTVFTPQIIEGAIPWTDKAYAAAPDLPSVFDVMGVHTYMAYPPQRAPEFGELDDAPVAAKVGMHAWLLQQHGGSSKPIWITELGWPVYGSVDENVQARFLVRSTLLAARAGAEGIFWYTLRDGPRPQDFPPEDAFGLVHHDSSPKPAYAAFKSMLSAIGARHLVQEGPAIADLPSDGFAVRAHADGMSDIAAVWTTGSSAQVHVAGMAIAIGPDPVWVTLP